MRKVMVLALVAAAGALAFACGDDDDDKGGGGAGGPNKCDPGEDISGGDGCSDAQKKAYGECVENACQDKYAECYGPGYKNGNYSGACGDYMECTTACDCDDDACRQACTASSACTSCMIGFAGCALSCQDKLACALGDSGVSFTDGGISFGDGGFDLGDAGISINDGSISFGDATFGNGKTCADLLTCCNSLSDATEKTQCTTTHGQFSAIGSFGDIACGESVATFCP